MKGIESAEVMLEDEVLTPPDMRTIQLKQPELCQQIPRRHSEDLHQTITRKCTVLTFPIQARSQFRDPQIGRDQTGGWIGKEPIHVVGALLDVIAFDERAGVDIEKGH